MAFGFGSTQSILFLDFPDISVWCSIATLRLPLFLYLQFSMAIQSGEHSSEVMSLRLSLEKQMQKNDQLEQELRALKSSASRKSMKGNIQKQSDELLTLRQRLEDELKERGRLESENRQLREQAGFLSDDEEVCNLSTFTYLITSFILIFSYFSHCGCGIFKKAYLSTLFLSDLLNLKMGDAKKCEFVRIVLI